MAYQNVGSTPRFYIDHGLWLYSIGYWTPPYDNHIPAIQLNPSNQQPNLTDDNNNIIFLHVPRVAPINYVAYLGHNLASVGGWCYPEWFDGSTYANATGKSSLVLLIHQQGI